MEPRRQPLSLPPSVNATSNANTCTFTGLPAAIQPATLDQLVCSPGESYENNSVVGGPSPVQVKIVHGSGTLTLFFNGSANGWTNSGVKGTSANPGATFSYLLS